MSAPHTFNVMWVPPPPTNGGECPHPLKMCYEASVNKKNYPLTWNSIKPVTHIERPSERSNCIKYQGSNLKDYFRNAKNVSHFLGNYVHHGWSQIRFIKYKYKYKYIFFRSFKYKYKYTGKNLIKYKYKYKYSPSNTNTNTQWGWNKIATILQMTYWKFIVL